MPHRTQALCRWTAVVCGLVLVVTAAPATATTAPAVDPAANSVRAAKAPGEAAGRPADEARGSGKRAAAAACPNEEDPDLDYLCPVGPTYTIPGLTDITGWDEPEHYRNILPGDLDGDGVDELVARSTGGVQVFRFHTDLGQWSQVPIDPILPDNDKEHRTDWTEPKYYHSLQLGDVDGDGNDELVARASGGILVFRFERDTASDTPQWKWTQISASHPFSDSGHWGDDPRYYSTIQLVPLGRDPQSKKPTMQLLGRGSGGLTLQRWTGDSWAGVVGGDETEFGDAQGWGKPECYRTIQAWNEDLLLAYCDRNVFVYRFTAAGSWERVGAERVTDDKRAFWESDSSPMLPFRGHGPAGQPVVLGRDATAAMWAIFDEKTKGWTYTQPNQAVFDDSRWGTEPKYYKTIRSADIDGDGQDEAIGRGGRGIEEHTADFAKGRWQSWNTFSLQLLDDPWGRDASYYETIQPVDLDPTGNAKSLIGRGSHGIRTWSWNSQSHAWTRPRPYGSFPALDTKAYNYLSRQFLGIERGWIRDVYSRDSATEATLNSYRTALERTCSDETAGNPPTYKTCTAPAGSDVTDATWTKTANQIIAELYWATWTLGHFASLDHMQTHLFLDEGNALPTINEDLKLAQAADKAKPEGVDWLELFESALDIVAVLVPETKVGERAIKVLEVTAGALGVTAAAVPELSSDDDGEQELAKTYVEVRTKVGQLQDEMTIALQDHRRYITADYGLLSTVGHLASAQIWTFDEKAALSVSRLQFTRWVYEQFLPVLWERYDASRAQCVDYEPFPACVPPANGPWMRLYEVVRYYDPNERMAATSFDGLFPIQKPPAGAWHWYLLDGAYRPVLDYVTGDIPADCEYSPETGRGAWVYGKCPLGVTQDELYDYDFAVHKCTDNRSVGWFYQFHCDNRPASLTYGQARNLGSTNGRLVLRYSHPVSGPVDLRGATVSIQELLHDARAADDMVAHPNGRDLFPRHFKVRKGATQHRATLGTPRGAPWQLDGTITYKKAHKKKAGDKKASRRGEGTLEISLRVRGVTLDELRSCDAPGGTRWFRNHLLIEDRKDRTFQILGLVNWQCSPDGSPDQLRYRSRR